MIAYLYFFFTFIYFLISLNLNLIYYYFTNNFNELLINILYQSIEFNGCILIKFTQWYLTRYELYFENEEFPIILKKFKNFYEKCKIHSYEYTEYLLDNKFFNKKYKIINKSPIASGSIAQIYEGINDETNEKIAIKVMHPYIKEQMFFPKLFVYILEYLSDLSFLNYYIFIPFKLDDFVKNLDEQIDLNKEYNNLLIFNKNFKKNNLVIFPKPYFSSKKILVMSFEEGVSFEDINLSDFEKYKIIMTLVLAIRQMCLIDNLIHCDLHIGNWKVINNNDKYKKIIILDCGLSLSPNNKNIIKDWFNAWEENKIKDINKIFREQIIYNKDSNINEINIQLDKVLINNLEHAKPLNINKLIKKLNIFLKKNRLRLNNNILNMIIIMSLIENNLKKYNFTGDPNIKNKDIQLNDCYRKQYLDYIAFCNATNEFNEIKELVITKLNESETKYENLFDFVEEKLYYSDINVNKVIENKEIELSL